MGVLVAGCGQPLQINTPPTPRSTQVAAPPTQLPAAGTAPTAADIKATPNTNQPFVTAEAVPEAPTVVAAPIDTPAVVVVPQTAVPLNNEQRWRTQQLNRQVFDQQRLYIANNDVTLLWYDPMTGQSLMIGTIRGEFPAQAQFTLRSDRRPAFGSSLSNQPGLWIDGDIGGGSSAHESRRIQRKRRGIHRADRHRRSEVNRGQHVLSYGWYRQRQMDSKAPNGSAPRRSAGLFLFFKGSKMTICSHICVACGFQNYVLARARRLS